MEAEEGFAEEAPHPMGAVLAGVRSGQARSDQVRPGRGPATHARSCCHWSVDTTKGQPKEILHPQLADPRGVLYRATPAPICPRGGGR